MIHEGLKPSGPGGYYGLLGPAEFERARKPGYLNEDAPKRQANGSNHAWEHTSFPTWANRTHYRGDISVFSFPVLGV